MLGEATHGTSDYYVWRLRITKQLVEQGGFSFLAVEGDWPECDRVDRYVKGRPGSGLRASQVLHAFARWPTWLWGNWEVVQVVEWLKHVNQLRDPASQIGFYGLDVYSLWESQQAVIGYLEESDPAAARRARAAYSCFDPFGRDAQTYAYATLTLDASCEDEVVQVLCDLRRHQLPEDDDWFNAEQNALVVQNAERYYRAMVRGGAQAWNLRDQHMMDSLRRLLDHHGPTAKAVVWAHNTHVGDARFTDMRAAGEFNLGQLARESGVPTRLVGFGSYQGSVIAADGWGEPMRQMRVPPARPGSVEALLHTALAGNGWLWLRGVTDADPLNLERGHRAIGVVYNPAYEQFGNYVPTRLASRYDAFLFLDQTSALHPLRLYPRAGHEPPDTFPWAV